MPDFKPTINLKITPLMVDNLVREWITSRGFGVTRYGWHPSIKEKITGGDMELIEVELEDNRPMPG